MKVLFLTHYDNMYGANKALFQLMKGLSQNKEIEMILVIPAEGEMTRALEQLNIRYEICQITQWQAIYRDPIRFAVKKRMRKKQIEKELDYLTELLKYENIDLIHSNSSVIGTGAMLAERLNCRHIWHIREFAKEHFGMEYFYPGKYVKRLYEKADYVIAISDSLKDNYRNKYPFANILRIYDGVTLSENELEKRESEIKQNMVRFCYLGYLFSKKNQLDVIEACHKLKEMKYENFEVYLVGGGKTDYQKKLEKKIAKYQLNNVFLTGYKADAQQFLNSIDVGIIASEYEGFGLVTVEYMLHSLPVIGRNSGGTAEIILDSETGCLYDDMNGLVEAMRLMLENPEIRKKMGCYGRERALTKFSESNNTTTMLKLYDHILSDCNYEKAANAILKTGVIK